MEIYTPAPSPENQGWKNSAFWFLRGFILDLWGWGFAVPFYSVQDKSLSQSFCLVTQRSSPLLGKERCVTRQKQLRGMLCIIRHVIFPQMCRKWVNTFPETINKKVNSSGRLFKPCLAKAWQNRVLRHFHFAQEAPKKLFPKHRLFEQFNESIYNVH